VASVYSKVSLNQGDGKSFNYSKYPRGMLVFLCRLIYNAFIMPIFSTHAPRAGSGVVRMDPLRFLAGCRTRRL